MNEPIYLKFLIFVFVTVFHVAFCNFSTVCWYTSETHSLFMQDWKYFMEPQIFVIPMFVFLYTLISNFWWRVLLIYCNNWPLCIYEYDWCLCFFSLLYYSKISLMNPVRNLITNDILHNFLILTFSFLIKILKLKMREKIFSILFQ